MKLIPTKTLTLIQGIICILIAAVMLALSFGTVFTVTVSPSESSEELIKKISDKVTDDGEEPIEIPESVNVSLVSIIVNAVKIPRVVNAVIDAANDIDKLENDVENSDGVEDIETVEGDAEAVSSDIEALADSFRDKEFCGFVFMMVESFRSSILLGIAYLFLLIMVIALPFAVTISFIVMLIKYFIKVKHPEYSFSSAAKGVGFVFGVLPVFWLIDVIIPEARLSGNIKIMTALCAVAVMLCIVASRLKCYNKEEFKYLNIIQAISLGGFIGWCLFFFGIKEMGLFTKICESNFVIFSSNMDVKSLGIALTVAVLLIVFVCASLKYVKDTLFRLAGMVSVGKHSKHDLYLAEAIFAILTVITVLVAVAVPPEISISDQMGAFSMLAAGALIILAAEICMMILPSQFDSKATLDEMKGVLAGRPTGTENEIN